MTYPVFASGDVLNAADMNGVGLWKVASGSLSSAVNFVGCFSANYTNYKMIVTVDTHSGGAANIVAQPLVGTTPNTTAADYRNAGMEQAYSASPSIVVFGNGGSVASWPLGRLNGDGASAIFYTEIFNPFATQKTFFKSEYVDSGYSGRTGGLVTVTTSYDGIRLTGPTMTGNVTIYGYNK
jgi:hypothetical protein